MKYNETEDKPQCIGRTTFYLPKDIFANTYEWLRHFDRCMNISNYDLGKFYLASFYVLYYNINANALVLYIIALLTFILQFSGWCTSTNVASHIPTI